MGRSGKRIIVACLLAALGLMLFPPWRGTHYLEHRLLWNGRGSPDWSRLALELCLVAVIGILAAVGAPMVGRPSARALKGWFHRAGLVSGCAAVTILTLTAGYDAIINFSLLREYDRTVQEFQANTPLLQEAFPLSLSPTETVNGYQVEWNEPISNVHEAELMLHSLGCDDSGIQRATARFLSSSIPEYDSKTLTFEIGSTGENHADCLPKDIFDQVAGEQGVAAKPTTPQSGLIPEYREIGFDFRIESSEAAKRFFAPLPDWHTEALQHKIEVDRVPDWMKPGEPPAPWSFGEWLELRSSRLILVVGMLMFSASCFIFANRIDSLVIKN